MQEQNNQDQKKENKISKHFFVVGIGASAGGLDAFTKFISSIPEDSGMAFIFVQHLDPKHSSQLPQILQRNTALSVKEIEDKMQIEPNILYIIPSNKTLTVKDDILELNLRPDDSSNYLPIDSFLSSLARAYGPYASGVVLSGTGSDGTRGLKTIKDHGGVSFAQDELSAAYLDMPRNAREAQVVDFVLPPEKIPLKILEVMKTMNTSNVDDEDQQLSKNIVQSNNKSQDNKKEEEVFQKILALLRIRKETDFTYYKQTTIRRRIFRRIALCNINSLESYLEYIRNNLKEQDLLYQDLLIPVTNFFRDARIFENLHETVFSKVLKHKDNNSIRIWIAGCSTGEEVYSIAICLSEFLQRSGIKNSHKENLKVQIFGTDISEPAISKARKGIYKKRELEGVSDRRLQEFFTKTDGSYHLHKDIREMCVFSIHNFLKDPPFGKMDFISCRNVLIYMQPYLQKKALTNFHYALNRGGLLLLGKSETISSVPELYKVAEREDKLFTRKDHSSKYKPTTRKEKRSDFQELEAYAPAENKRTDFQKSADEIILNQYSPSGVVVNEAMDIVYFRGNTNKYLEQSTGKPTHNLLKMAKMGLAFELRNIVHKVKKEPADEFNKKASVIKEGVPIQVNGEQHKVTIEALSLPKLVEPYYLILFHERYEAGNAKPVRLTKDERDSRIHQLEQELSHTREDMRSITEDQEATNEELQSANEELQSSREELQSLNEELETSKEELQSSNEELQTLNHELVSNNRRLTESKNYSQDIIATLREPLVVLDHNLKVKSANAVFYKKFQLKESEIEENVIFDLENKSWNIAGLRNLLEKILPEHSSFSDFEITHDFPGLGTRTVLLNAKEIYREEGGEKLILLVFEDITDKRMTEKNLQKSEIKFQLLVESISQLIWISNGEGKIEFFNRQWENFTGINSAESVKDDIWEDSIHYDDLQEFKDEFVECIDSGKSFTKETRLKAVDNGYKWFLAKAVPYYNAEGEILKWFGSFTNIETQKQAEATLKKSEEDFRQLAELIPDKISKANTKGKITYYNQSWLRYTGLTHRQLKTQGLAKFINPHERWKMLRKWRTSLDAREDFEIEVRLLNTAGEYCWHLVRAIPVKGENGEVKLWIGATTEIQKIKEEEKRKEDFLKIISHELKTPVTSIKGYTQLLLDMLKRDVDIDLEALPLKPSLERIDNQVSRLTRLISEILDLSRMENNKMELHKASFNINTMVEECVQDINYSSTDSTIKISHNGKADIYGDKDRIGQVLINFITNAIKYSPDDKTIEVEIFKPSNDQVSVSVKDHGIGIDKKHQEHIFKRFYRVSQKNEETYSGFGIGLYLAKEIIGRHQGTITVNSVKDEGSEFIFTLPINPVL